ncbi:cation diffusion facilitator family transporter [Yimella radicis]
MLHSAHAHKHTHLKRPRLSALRHGLSHLFGGHSHDVADQIDDALEADAAGRRALWISLGLLALTAAFQGVVVVFTGSVALLGDTLHNVGDALTAIPILVAFSLARRPATRRFTYGLARAEDLAGLFVVVMIALSGLLTVWEAVRRLIEPRAVDNLGVLALAGFIGFLGNEVVAQYRIRVGRRIGSAALVADGLHARTDGFTSLAVVLSAAGLALGWTWADAVIGILIAVAIFGVLRSAFSQVATRLLDGVDPELTETAEDVLDRTVGLDAVDRLQLRWLGHALYVEVDLVGSDIATADLSAQLERALPRVGSVRIRWVTEIRSAGATSWRPTR